MLLRRIHHVMLFNNVFGEDFLAYEYINFVKCECVLKNKKYFSVWNIYMKNVVEAYIFIEYFYS